MAAVGRPQRGIIVPSLLADVAPTRAEEAAVLGVDDGSDADAPDSDTPGSDTPDRETA